jgi:hypothetical protein
VNLLMKGFPRSETIVCGTPWRATICLITIYVSCGLVVVSWQRIRWVIFVNRSTTTRMESKGEPWGLNGSRDGGSFTMKSMVMASHSPYGMDNDFS